MTTAANSDQLGKGVNIVISSLVEVRHLDDALRIVHGPLYATQQTHPSEGENEVPPK